MNNFNLHKYYKNKYSQYLTEDKSLEEMTDLYKYKSLTDKYKTELKSKIGYNPSISMRDYSQDRDDKDPLKGKGFGDISFYYRDDLPQNDFNKAIKWLESKGFEITQETNYYETDIDDDRAWYPKIKFNFDIDKTELSEGSCGYTPDGKPRSKPASPDLNEGVEKSMFTFLNDLRDSGITNMFGAGSYLEDEFGLDKREAREVLAKWMRSFEEDKNEIDRDRIFMKGKVNENRAQDLASDYSLNDLNDMLKQLYGEMEQEAEPEGGPIANQYADEIYQYEEAIRIKKGVGQRGKKDLTYDQAIGREDITDETGTYTLRPDGTKDYKRITPMTRDEFEKSSKFDKNLKEEEYTLDFGELDEADMTKNPSPEYVSKILQVHGKSKEEADKIVQQLSALGKKNPQKEQELTEKLCKKGEAYRKRRMAAGEKSSAYLSGRAVKVCKGQMSGKKNKK